MRFLVDAQLPPALARWLDVQGHEAKHVVDLDMAAASDASIWSRASEERAVIVTKDEDFAVWRTAVDGPVPVIVWLRFGNTRRSELLRRFEVLLPQIMSAMDAGETLIEIE
ncbi:MAG: hypothetical protein FKY71_13130 [Spiribacter salinus]|uniref:DUF5615 domain-containing protein n=1 Tax=Spiribacter salinus TaxID=1335746 RepID=A0A540VPK8_9GAMM|nr:MAG: hypothetical protein FKY71_13130 [Spiribacter salinus]